MAIRNISGRVDRGLTIFNALVAKLEELTFEVKEGDPTGKPKKAKQQSEPK